MALKGIVHSTDYTFSAANKTITFSNDYLGMSLSDITYITNIKSGVAVIIYDPFDLTKGGTLNGLTLTLQYSTIAMSDSDPLQIIIGFTPINPDPAPVKIIPQSNDVDQTQLLQNISDDLDLIALATDQSEGVQVNTRDVYGPYKKDVNNAYVLSDGILATSISIGAGATITTPSIDTQGYQSVQIYWSSTNLFSFSGIYYSADGINFGSQPTPVNALLGSSQGVYSSTSTSGVPCQFISNIIGRYCRVNFTNSGVTAGTLYIYLRNIPAPQIMGYNSSGNMMVDLQTIRGSLPGKNQVLYNGAVSASNSSFSVGNQNAPGSSTVDYPIMVGGREAPSTGQLGGLIRQNLLDPQGRFILGGDYDGTRPRDPVTGVWNGPNNTAPVRGVGGIPNNMVGAQNLTTTDTSQVDGDTNTMLLKQVLQELKILNQQLIEIPFLLNAGESTMSDPQEYRNDNSNLF